MDLHASIMNIPADRNRSDRAYKEGHRDARHAAAEMALAAEEEIERLKAENAALVKALAPFIQDGFQSTLGGNAQGDESPVYGREKSLLRLGDFRRAKAAYDKARAESAEAADEIERLKAEKAELVEELETRVCAFCGSDPSFIDGIVAQKVTAALAKIRAHTALPLEPSKDLLVGLIKSIERITDEALARAESAEAGNNG
jgi:hypothetical protein